PALRTLLFAGTSLCERCLKNLSKKSRRGFNVNISTLHQFLQTLISPLKASEASQRTVADLERMMRGLEPFADKPVGDFASFLERAHGHERDGDWPPSSPPIKRALLDRPSSAAYAVRP